MTSNLVSASNLNISGNLVCSGNSILGGNSANTLLVNSSSTFYNPINYLAL